VTKTVISIEHLSKYYRLGLIGGGTLREDVDRWWAKVRGKPDPLATVDMEDQKSRKGGEIWALRDVNLEVKEGEILGVIGRNGAGKSTLLKILSRITAPTSGSAVIRGRVGSLLEVGTGFHPELTGRENIYLNGTILGMTKPEVARKLDEIVEFAEMSKFIDTPVKRYSSGMTVRLAFAVAAHLEPEILIVDEVLAVGDATFQAKCLGKMRDVTATDARTVLFVSHNMASIQSLCHRAVYLDKGRVSYNGEVDAAISRYNSEAMGLQATSLSVRPDRKGNGVLRFVDCYFTDGNGKRLEALMTGKNILVHLKYTASQDIRNINVAFNLYEHSGNVLMNFNCVDAGGAIPNASSDGEFVCEIPRFPLRAGRYFGNLHCTVNGQVADWVEEAFVVDAIDGDFFGTGKLVSQGKFVAKHHWRVKSLYELHSTDGDSHAAFCKGKAE